MRDDTCTTVSIHVVKAHGKGVSLMAWVRRVQYSKERVLHSFHSILSLEFMGGLKIEIITSSYHLKIWFFFLLEPKIWL